MKTSKAVVLSLAALSLLSASCSQSALSATRTKASNYRKLAATINTDEPAIRARLQSFRDAVAAGDAKAMASHWTQDAHYTDDEGSEFVGHDAIEKTFIEAVNVNGRPQVELVAESIRFPADSQAEVKGVVKKPVTGKLGAIPITSFSMTLVKDKAGQWLISSGKESPIASNGNPLDELSWLLGNWTAQQNGGTMHLKAEWVPSKKFITCRYEIKRANEPDRIETQVIGWDPKSGHPVSWNFDSIGGFGEGVWIKRNNQWLVEAQGTAPDGSTTIATNVVVAESPKAFTWQSVDRRINGVPVGDLQQVKIQKIEK